MLGWAALLLILVLFYNECQNFGWGRTLASSFWVFTLFFTLSYPVKYILIGSGVIYQAPTKPGEFYLVIALTYAMCMWLLIYLLRARSVKVLTNPLNQKTLSHVNKNEWALGAKILFPLMMCISLLVYYDLYLRVEDLLLAFEGNAQNEMRVGNGSYFVLFSLYLYVFLIALFSRYRLGYRLHVTLIALAIPTAVLEMLVLGTRRPLFLIVYAILLSWIVEKPNNNKLFILGAFPAVMAFMAPVGQALRYNIIGIMADPVAAILDSFEIFYISIGSTFEGIEHLANYLETASVKNLILGVDQGMSWLFNSGLSLVPRGLWESKPYLYGSVFQQALLYPEMYATGYGQTTFPLGFIVDSLFGFGLIGIFLFAIFYAYLFKHLDEILFTKKNLYHYNYLIAATIYIHMFNLVRGGTATIMLIIFIIAIAVPINFVHRMRLRMHTPDRSHLTSVCDKANL